MNCKVSVLTLYDSILTLYVVYQIYMINYITLFNIGTQYKLYRNESCLVCFENRRMKNLYSRSFRPLWSMMQGEAELLTLQY